MTLVLKLDLDMVKMYLCTKNEIFSYSSSKAVAQTDRHTDTYRDRQTQLKLLPIHIGNLKFEPQNKDWLELRPLASKYSL